MAIRAPLYYDAGDLKEMTTAMVDTIIDQCVYQYSLDTSVSLSIVPSGGSLGSLTDTRQQAGTVSTHQSSFPTEATTNEPTTVIITYDKIQQTVSGGFSEPYFYNRDVSLGADIYDDIYDFLDAERFAQAAIEWANFEK